MLLIGPPGTGKTLMARAVAGEAAVPFFSISASEFVELFVGVGASRVRDLFTKAKAAAPAIVFVDEIDAVGRQRGAGLGGGNDEREQTLNQLLVEMDGFDDQTSVIVLAATNRPDVLDPALLRPGRFDRQVTVAFPDRPGREAILRDPFQRRSRSPRPWTSVLIAQSTPGFSGADLANLANEAALRAARKNTATVTQEDFEEALDSILLGTRQPGLTNVDERRLVAYHEGGHAIVARLTPGADPVHRVTIVPHGQALGVTEQRPDEDRRNYPRDYLMGRLAVSLGGRAAEDVVFGQPTTGAESDLKAATEPGSADGRAVGDDRRRRPRLVRRRRDAAVPRTRAGGAPRIRRGDGGPDRRGGRRGSSMSPTTRRPRSSAEPGPRSMPWPTSWSRTRWSTAGGSTRSWSRRASRRRRRTTSACPRWWAATSTVPVQAPAATEETASP